MIDKLKSKEKKIAVIGLGYVGLPLALQFAGKYSVIGFDINEQKVEMMASGVDPSKEVETQDFENKDIIFTTKEEDLVDACFYVVAVPTPIDQHKVPNLKPLFGASETVGKVISRGDIVVFESTVYPGCTEDDCIPIIERESGLKGGLDFHFGYSPERINPGDKAHTVSTIIKVVSGNNPEVTDMVAGIYGSVIPAGIFKASCVRVAEAAKVIENTQRDLNIAFMNELSIIFDKMKIDTKEVLDAASTKWNFLSFYPGLVGGHCIGVDPYYLTYKSQQLGYTPEVILSGRRINDGMPAYIAKQLVQKMLKKDMNPKDSDVLVMGITFKENVADIRNSKVGDLVKELKNYSISVDVVDPHADRTEVKEEYGIQLIESPDKKYDAVIVAVSHEPYKKMAIKDFQKVLKEGGMLMDIKGVYDFKGGPYEYWRL